MNEFKKIKNDNETRYVLETMTAGATGAGSIATAEKDIGEVQKRVPDAPKPRNFVAKNAKMGSAGQHKDKKKAEKQGDTKHKNKSFDMAEGKDEKIAQLKKDHDTAVHWSKNETSPQKREAARRKAGTIKAHLEKQYKQGVAEGFNGEYDDEAGMAQSNLLTTARAVMGLLKTIKDRDNLPEWGQEKIAKAEMMLVSVWDYLQSQKEMGNDPQVEEGVEDRTSYQVAKILFDKGIKYDPAQEDELINAIGMVLVKELTMSPKQARHLISYDEDFVSDTLGELGNMESSVSEVAPPGWEKTVKAMKKHDNIDNPFALAWSMKNKGYKSHKKESADPYLESLAAKVEAATKK